MKSQNYHYSNEENFSSIDVEAEYPFMHKPFAVDNFENQYKVVPYSNPHTTFFSHTSIQQRMKICKSCFIIYSLTAKHFDERLKLDMRKTSSSKTFSSRRPNTTNLPLTVGGSGANVSNSSVGFETADK